MADAPVLVCGAGGFIGGHLVRHLLEQESRAVRAVDLKPFQEWHQRHPAADNRRLDLRSREACDEAVRGVADVYNLACDMGGMGFIEHNRALCMLNVLINTHLLMASAELGVRRYFFASSACVYNATRQSTPNGPPLRESDAYPAMPEDGYGWEKLFSERMCRHFREDFGLETRVARYHNIYGPHGTYEGGREKAPAAVCRKVITAKLVGEDSIEIWGDGRQTRSFTYIDDCIHGTRLLMESDVAEPLNIGSSESVTINELVDLVEDMADVRLLRRYDRTAPHGVFGRNSDNSRIQTLLGWQPSTPLREGMAWTFRWIHDQLVSRGPAGAIRAGAGPAHRSIR
ncbi:MAG: NAD-dependent epimerase/dehydratase family protein [Acidobacteria bacterium]|nr:NAD-dependent epimerase/dehydratase family protein [Acidobacteriota bacterium]